MEMGLFAEAGRVLYRPHYHRLHTKTMHSVEDSHRLTSIRFNVTAITPHSLRTQG